MPRRTLLIGCGYVGLPLARELLARGDMVDGWVHSPESAMVLEGEGFRRIITGSVGQREAWRLVDTRYDLVIHAASSGGGGLKTYKEVFVDGARFINECQPQARRILVSSTSVYGQTDGEIVTEDSQAAGGNGPSQVLLFAESEGLRNGAIVVRASGIYGPGRRVLFEKLRRGEAVIDGDGSRWLNQIHRDDLVAAILYLVDHGQKAEIYNATDDEPVRLRDYYTWCAEFLSRPLPPYGPVDPKRKRGLTSKRVSNAKLRGLGWVPKFPTFREGHTGIGRN